MGKALDSLVYRLRRNLWRCNLRKFLVDLDEVEIDRPIFLLGTQGGGLTLLSRVLRRHPSAVSVTGDHRYWNGADEMQNVLAPILPDALSFGTRAGLEQHGGAVGWYYASDEMLPRYRRTASDATEEQAETLRRILKEVLALFAGTRPCRFVDKSQTYTVKVGFLEALLRGTEPRYVLVTRNPFALCYRAVQRTDLARLDRGHEEKLRLAAQHWSNSMRCALEDGSGSGRLCTLRFEDFLRRPEQELGRLCEFLGLDCDPGMLPAADDEMPLGGLRDGKWYPLRPDVNERYLRALSTPGRRLIERVCGELARRFGYGPGGDDA